MGEPAIQPLELMPLMARGLAILEAEDLTEGNLTLELGLSLWMRRTDSSLKDMKAALLRMRSALLEAAVMDREHEPIPLLAGDDRTAVLGLAVYLKGLVTRAAITIGATRREIVEEALSLIDG
jgi:hypothetical protein